ncbi:MAG: FIVAR domain-containing protein [Christensenellaceae bacterium]|jgi:hypothetical protein|nr:FIVAR domain-containing protein [Christensenellaceae bacterium]
MKTVRSRFFGTAIISAIAAAVLLCLLTVTYFARPDSKETAFASAAPPIMEGVFILTEETKGELASHIEDNCTISVYGDITLTNFNFQILNKSMSGQIITAEDYAELCSIYSEESGDDDEWFDAFCEWYEESNGRYAEKPVITIINTNNLPLFNNVTATGAIEDIDFVIKTGTNGTGAIAGINAGTINRCSVEVKYNNSFATSPSGGVVYTNYEDGIIENVQVSASFNGTPGAVIGGFAYENYGTIQNVKLNAGFTGELSVPFGGIVYDNYGTIQDGEVTGNSFSSNFYAVSVNNNAGIITRIRNLTGNPFALLDEDSDGSYFYNQDVSGVIQLVTNVFKSEDVWYISNSGSNPPTLFETYIKQTGSGQAITTPFVVLPGVNNFAPHLYLSAFDGNDFPHRIIYPATSTPFVINKSYSFMGFGIASNDLPDGIVNGSSSIDFASFEKVFYKNDIPLSPESNGFAWTVGDYTFDCYINNSFEFGFYQGSFKINKSIITLYGNTFTVNYYEEMDENDTVYPREEPRPIELPFRAAPRTVEELKAFLPTTYFEYLTDGFGVSISSVEILSFTDPSGTSAVKTEVQSAGSYRIKISFAIVNGDSLEIQSHGGDYVNYFILQDDGYADNSPLIVNTMNVAVTPQFASVSMPYNTAPVLTGFAFAPALQLYEFPEGVVNSLQSMFERVYLYNGEPSPGFNVSSYNADSSYLTSARLKLSATPPKDYTFTYNNVPIYVVKTDICAAQDVLFESLTVDYDGLEHSLTASGLIPLPNTRFDFQNEFSMPIKQINPGEYVYTLTVTPLNGMEINYNPIVLPAKKLIINRTQLEITITQVKTVSYPIDPILSDFVISANKPYARADSGASGFSLSNISIESMIFGTFNSGEFPLSPGGYAFKVPDLAAVIGLNTSYFTGVELVSTSLTVVQGNRNISLQNTSKYYDTYAFAPYILNGHTGLSVPAEDLHFDYFLDGETSIPAAINYSEVPYRVHVTARETGCYLASEEDFNFSIYKGTLPLSFQNADENPLFFGNLDGTGDGLPMSGTANYTREFAGLGASEGYKIYATNLSTLHSYAAAGFAFTVTIEAQTTYGHIQESLVVDAANSEIPFLTLQSIGTYSNITITVTGNPNYNEIIPHTARNGASITKKVLRVTGTLGTVPYTGKVQTIVLNSYQFLPNFAPIPSANVALTVISKEFNGSAFNGEVKNAGTYTVFYGLDSNNYYELAVSGNSASLTISKATVNLDFSKLQKTVVQYGSFDGSMYTQLTYPLSSEDFEIAQVYITSDAQNSRPAVGLYSVIGVSNTPNVNFTFSNGANYFEIVKNPLQFSFGDFPYICDFEEEETARYPGVYNIPEEYFAGKGRPVGSNWASIGGVIIFTQNGTVTEVKAPGEYIATVTLTGSNYKFADGETLTKVFTIADSGDDTGDGDGGDDTGDGNDDDDNDNPGDDDDNDNDNHGGDDDDDNDNPGGGDGDDDNDNDNPGGGDDDDNDNDNDNPGGGDDDDNDNPGDDDDNDNHDDGGSTDDNLSGQKNVLSGILDEIAAGLEEDTLKKADYPEEIWEEFQAKYAAAQAILANPTSTLNEINEAITALNEIRAALEEAKYVEGDKTPTLKPVPKPPLDGGVIAIIVVGSVLGAALIGGIIIAIIKKFAKVQ